MVLKPAFLYRTLMQGIGGKAVVEMPGCYIGAASTARCGRWGLSSLSGEAGSTPFKVVKQRINFPFYFEWANFLASVACGCDEQFSTCLLP